MALYVNTFSANNASSVTVRANNISISGRYLDLPKGDTSQRPASVANGMIRFNTQTNRTEVYLNGWFNLI